ncbi:MAG: nickel pincer cofactor biosynthesis protein LarB [Opitutae bacterium]|nr:nickel pincer cofactor biosynthesis protein LarB [Opitutae bacterium]MCD8298464.1 nickel pincer cofactor biosynthesis protein LarB [Opitutae bacterium]
MSAAREVLENLKAGKISLDEAELFFARRPFEELGNFAKLDSHRETRTGVPEVVFCAGKSDEHLLAIFKKLCEADGRAFGTRANARQFELLKNAFPHATFDPVSRIIKIENPQAATMPRTGKIAVCCAGTADIPVAEEAAQTAEYFGGNVERIFDVGVSGLHRLLAHLDKIQSANCIVAIAGMEGALASVLGGLTRNPVIAVPTSVGYGASFHGLAALLTMLNSCANGVSVVNIDNGFGAGFIAAQINRLARTTDPAAPENPATNPSRK